MCALRTHINFHFWKNFFSRIEKVMTAFSIPEKMFLKIESLMCALRAHINRTHIRRPKPHQANSHRLYSQVVIGRTYMGPGPPDIPKRIFFLFFIYNMSPVNVCS